jgi:hypothetical protein
LAQYLEGYPLLIDGNIPEGIFPRYGSQSILLSLGNQDWH